jgi:hypothetical protein
MTQQIINVGASANDGTGDTLRSGATKINANFAELYANNTTQIPSQTGNAGLFLATDGTSLTWSSVSSAVLPSQSGNSGKFLTTNGTSASWGSVTNITGNAGTVTNGVYTTGSYADPNWISSLSASKLTGTVNIPLANLAGGAAGSIPYQSSNTTTLFLAAGPGVLVGGTPPVFSTTPALTGTNFTSIPNGALSNSSITIGSSTVSLGSSVTTISGLTSLTTANFTYTGLQIIAPNYISVSTSGTYALSTVVSINILTVASNGLTATLTFPLNPANGQVIQFTVASNSVTLALTAGPTLTTSFAGSVTAGTTFQYVYNQTNAYWVKL